MPAFIPDDPNQQLNVAPTYTGNTQSDWGGSQPTPQAPATPESKISGFPGFLLGLSQGATNLARGVGLGGLSDLLAMSQSAQSVQKLTGINPAMSSQDVSKRMMKTPVGNVVNPATAGEDIAGAASWMLPATVLGKGIPGLIGSGILKGGLAGASQPAQNPLSFGENVGIGGLLGGAGGGLSTLLHPIQTANNYITRAVEESPATIDMNGPLTNINQNLPSMASRSPYTTQDFTDAYNNFSNWLQDKISPPTGESTIPDAAVGFAGSSAPKDLSIGTIPKQAGGQILYEGGQAPQIVPKGTEGAIKLPSTNQWFLPAVPGNPVEIPPTSITADKYTVPSPLGGEQVGPRKYITPFSERPSMGETSQGISAAQAQQIKRLIPYIPDVLGNKGIVANAFGNPNASPGISIPATYYQGLSKAISSAVPGVNFPNAAASAMYKVPNTVNALAKLAPANIGQLLEKVGGLPINALQGLFPVSGSNMSTLLPLLLNGLNKSVNNFSSQ